MSDRNSERIKELEELAKFSLNQTSQQVYWIESNGRIIYVNDKAANKLGYNKNELKDKYIWNIKSNLVREDQKTKWEKLKKNSPTNQITKLEKKDGNTYPVKITSHYLEIADNEYQLDFAKVISEEKNDQKNSYELNRKMPLILDSMHELVIHLDLDGKIIWVNQAVLDDLDVDSREELEGEYCYELWHDRDERCEDCPTPQVKRSGKSFSGKVETPDGRNWLVSQSPVFNSEGDMDGIIEIAKDITERKRSMEKLRKSEKRLSQIIQGIPIPIIVLNDRHEITHWNKACEELTGIPQEDMIGRKDSWRPFYAEERPILADLVIEDSSKDVIDEYYENKYNEFSLLEGAYEGLDFFSEVEENGKWIYFTAAPLRNSNGEIIGSIETLQDVTELKKAQKQLGESEERKDFLNTLLRQDLGTKYRTIQGYLHLLSELDLPEEYEKYLKKAMKAGKKTDEILGLAKKLEELERNDWTTEKNINKILEFVINNILGIIKEKNIQLQKDIPNDLSKVKGDYSLNTLITQILVTRAQIGECTKIKINAKEKENKILVTIEDNGNPLPQDIKNLFTGEPYTGETTGVGGVRYYMLREIARHNNAEIKVKKSELGGPKFNIHLERSKNNN